MTQAWRRHALKLAAAIACFFGVSSPAFAFNVTDVFGNTCDASQLIGAGPGGGPPSICPASIPLFLNQNRVIFFPIFQKMNQQDQYLWLSTIATGLLLSGEYDGLSTSQINQMVNDENAAYPFLGGPVSVRLFGTDGTTGMTAGGDFVSTHNSGSHFSDSAGAVAANTPVPTSNSSQADEGAAITADGARLFGLDVNQKLLLRLTFDYQFTATSFGTSALAPGVATTGTLHTNTYKVDASATYYLRNYYFRGNASIDWNRQDLTNNVLAPGAQGSDNGLGYNFGLTVGKFIPVFNTTGRSVPMLAKTPPKQISGYATFIDLSGHVGYVSEHSNPFTDNTGFSYGSENMSYVDTGALAKLVWFIPDGGRAWLPYVGLGVEHQFGFKDTWNIPAQGATPADTLTFTQATTYGSALAGVSLHDRSGTRIDVGGFYMAAADMRSVGASATLKIPLWQPPATDGGIRATSK